MPRERETARAFRLGAQHDQLLDEIAEEKRWSDVVAVRAAIEGLHKQIFGRRAAADRVPVRVRRTGGGK
jgi:hypothetical protein